MSWDQKFMRLAQHIAGWSKDRGRKVGAVIVGPDNELRSTGYNGLPRGVRDDVEERHGKETGEKYLWCAHAERNAIYNAARVGIPVKGCRIYGTLYPCVDCVIALIQSGITELITAKPNFKDPQWGEGYKRADIMLKEAKIKVRYMDI
ncbi:MAG: dCMP deaminase family protein [Bdellovibrionales bacterium]|jgi:dCMP deaminase